MIKISSLLILALCCTVVNAQHQYTTEQFISYCDSNGLKFTMPEGYQRIDTKKNRDLYYSFAVVNEDKSMEIRFTVRPLADDIAAYEASLKDSNVVMIDPNRMYQGIVQANALNMTVGELPDIGAFPAEAVKREFNADSGGSCFFNFNCEFGKGYTYGQFIYLHKDNVADLIVTFMSNDLDTHSENMNVGFYALTFKE